MSVFSTKFSVCLVCEDSNHGVLLCKNITYTQLVEYVKKKFKIDDSYNICFSYKIGSKTFAVIDDDDVEFFANEVCKSKARVHNLFIKKTVQILKVNPSTSKSLDFDLNLALVPSDFESNNEFENAFVDVPNSLKKETFDVNEPFEVNSPDLPTSSTKN
ncbi:hypothetical protein CTI12_AA159810 [Artemisia annua]|uniref:PB1 domain-containing protein n=1 Tax=Artemisia annua TaxID=35608 RepID=A0A2U1PF55_ARTAN|nr:hypothetical protein CTI12_AA159810 [Artemisia annua]